MEEQDDREQLLAKVLAVRGAMLARRWLPGRDADSQAWRPRTVVVFSLVALGLVAIGVIAFLRSAPSSETPPPLAASTSSSNNSRNSAAPFAAASSAGNPSTAPQSLVISVVGKVAKAGLVRLDEGARVADAIAAAGGLVERVDVAKINLARRVSDGEQLFIGIPLPSWAQVQQAPPQSPPPAAAVGGPVGTTPGPGSKINLNTATPEQLDQLPGVGAATAKHIIDWRNQHGKFNTVQQLQDVNGIGETRFDKLKDLVAVQ